MDHSEAGSAGGNQGSAFRPSNGRPPTIPDHELLRAIGQGSYGEVWLARSVLGALRAVKVVYRERFRDARPYEREFNGILRVEPLSRASDGLVDILHVGRHEPAGYFYYVMELADDAGNHQNSRNPAEDARQYQPLTLARELKRCGRLTFEQCVQLGVNLSSALSSLHQSGLVHRDVKPSNILYVEGVPKLGDIGLVGETGETGSFVGTEGYIPPEGPGTPQADVFSLGKVLYEAATGLDRLEFPLLPANLIESGADARFAELNEIFVQACAADPRVRYQSAEELHADFSLLHRGQSVRRQRRAERRWRRTATAAPFLAALGGFALGALWSPLQHGRPLPVPDGPAAPVRLAKQEPISLSGHLNAELSQDWARDFAGNNLASLPAGWHRFGPAYFDVRGVVQLAGGYTQGRAPDFPGEVSGIKVGRKCSRLYFLHGTMWECRESGHVASYVVHYADGRSEEIPLRYGEVFRNWWWSRKEYIGVNFADTAWIGTNNATGDASKLVLYCLTWQNPFPNSVIARVDFTSARSDSCPFLLAITAE